MLIKFENDSRHDYHVCICKAYQQDKVLTKNRYIYVFLLFRPYIIPFTLTFLILCLFYFLIYRTWRRTSTNCTAQWMEHWPIEMIWWWVLGLWRVKEFRRLLPYSAITGKNWTSSTKTDWSKEKDTTVCRFYTVFYWDEKPVTQENGAHKSKQLNA